MSAVLKRAAGWLGFNEPVEYEDDYEEEIEYDQVQEQRITEIPTNSVQDKEEVVQPDLSRIITSRPSRFDEIVNIGEALRDNVPVIMNLTEVTVEETRRMIDFASGMVFALRGQIEKVTDRVFLLSPPSIKIEEGNLAHLPTVNK